MRDLRPGTTVLALSLSLALAPGCGSPARDMADTFSETQTASASGTGTDSGEATLTDGGSGSTSGGEKLDVGDGMGSDSGACPDSSGGGGTETFEFSIIWIANSDYGEGTVSKIDTQTATELARYRTGTNAYGDSPSRTSVNLDGDVVIANRGDIPSGVHIQVGSFTKITGDPDKCTDRNGDGVITTSQGPNDVLEWGEDDCVEWNYVAEEVAGLDQNGLGGARAVAWDNGSETGCSNGQDPNVWVGYKHGPDSSYVDLLEGSSTPGQPPAMLGRAEITDAEFTYDLGMYGGAVDKDGNIYVLGRDRAVARVDRQDFTVQLFPGGGYGIAVDADGYPWTVNGYGEPERLDPATGQWTTYPAAGSGGYYRGVTIDREGHLWSAITSCGLGQFDTNTGVWLAPEITIAGCELAVGVSVDYEGYVWVVDQDADQAYKMLPTPGGGATLDATVTGLLEPYTYSDMTGAALGLVTFPPQG
jgi:hypothetical protein